jgi:hypothetical protein
MFESHAAILTMPLGTVDLAKVSAGANVKLPDGSIRTVTSSDLAYGKGRQMIKLTSDVVKLSGVVEVVSASEAPKPEPVPVPAPQPGNRLFNPGFAMGINVAGAEFGNTLPGVHDKDYHHTSERYFELVADEGFVFVRYPFKLERLYQSLGGAFRDSELTLLLKSMDAAAKHGLQIKALSAQGSRSQNPTSTGRAEWRQLMRSGGDGADCVARKAH